MIDVRDGFIVYKLTNLVNGKVYIGVTKCGLRKRWNEHVYAGNRQTKKTIISMAISKYGKSNFTIELIKKCESEKEMYKTEIELIAYYKSNNNKFGYNNSIGGEKSSKGYKHSQETKRRLSEIQKRKKRKPHSEDTKNKMRKLALGRDMSKAILASSAIRKGKESKNAVPVSQYSLDGIFIKRFSSYKKAADSVGGIANGIYFIKIGRLKTYKSFLWKFEN